MSMYPRVQFVQEITSGSVVDTVCAVNLLAIIGRLWSLCASGVVMQLLSIGEMICRTPCVFGRSSCRASMFSVLTDCSVMAGYAVVLAGYAGV